jgi:hypothetical protein
MAPACEVALKSSLWLTILLTLGGCHSAEDGTNCKRGSDVYLGDIALTRNIYPESAGLPAPSVSEGGAAVYVLATDAGGVFPSSSASCGTASDPCCYVGPPPDAGDTSSGSLGIDLSDWNVTVTDESTPDAGSYGEIDLYADGGSGSPDAPPIAFLRILVWSGGDELLVQGEGAGTVGTFSNQLTAPPDFAGLNPGLLSVDGGAIPLGEDLKLTWTSGGASSVTIKLVDEATLGQVICTAPDTGSFTISRSLFSHFQSGDPGGFVVLRSAQSCAHSDNASIAILAQTQTIVRVTFQ